MHFSVKVTDFHLNMYCIFLFLNFLSFKQFFFWNACDLYPNPQQKHLDSQPKKKDDYM